MGVEPRRAMASMAGFGSDQQRQLVRALSACLFLCALVRARLPMECYCSICIFEGELVDVCPMSMRLSR